MNAKVKLFLEGWLIHLGLLLTVLLFFNFLHRHDQTEPISHYFARHLINKDVIIAAELTLLAEICYQYLFKKHNLFWFISGCLLSAAFMVIAYLWLRDKIDPVVKLNTIAPVVFTAGYIFIYALIRNYFYACSIKKDIQLSQSRHELDALKAQLNPHFLFNCLNYLYGTALREKAGQTAEGIDELSEMMRYTISGIHQNTVPLQNEIDFIAHYLKLQQARLPQKDSIKVNIVLPQQVPALQIAPLVLVPFIENAFKYGISMDEPCFVEIKISIDDTTLNMAAGNSIVAKPIEITGNNTGIKNTLKRLSLLYPGKYHVKQTSSSTQYHTTFQLQLYN